MSRIRSIKPGFFRHEVLFEAERETGLPMRLAFAGLWTVADREGRFRWQPRVLKLDILPFDNVDFGEILENLARYGLIVSYTVKGERLGCIPSWAKHQHINTREAASDLPPPDDASTCAHPPEPVQDQGEGKGREQEGKEKDARGGARVSFERFKTSYPRRAGANPWEPAFEKFERALKAGADPDAIAEGARRYAAECDRLKKTGTELVMQAKTWLNQKCWQDYAVSDVATEGIEVRKSDPRWAFLTARYEREEGKKFPHDLVDKWPFKAAWLRDANAEPPFDRQQVRA